MCGRGTVTSAASGSNERGRCREWVRIARRLGDEGGEAFAFGEEDEGGEASDDDDGWREEAYAAG